MADTPRHSHPRTTVRFARPEDAATIVAFVRGLAEFEQSPFLLIEGNGFAVGATRTDPTSAIDIAPTLLEILGLPKPDRMSGQSLVMPISDELDRPQRVLAAHG